MTKVLFAVASFFVLIQISNALPATSLNRSITEEIMNDEHICPTRSVYTDSRYANSCKSAKFPAKDIKLNDASFQQFLCLGLYDRIHSICYLGTLSSYKTPENAAVLDSLVEKLFSKNSTDANNLCKKLSIPRVSIEKYSKITSYVEQLDQAIEKTPSCMKLCFDWSNNVEPLCLLLLAVDEISQQLSLKRQEPPGPKMEHQNTDGSAAKEDRPESDAKAVAQPAQADDLKNPKHVPSKSKSDDTAHTEKKPEEQSPVGSKPKKIDLAADQKGALEPKGIAQSVKPAKTLPDNSKNITAKPAATSDGKAADNPAVLPKKSQVDTPDAAQQAPKGNDEPSNAIEKSPPLSGDQTNSNTEVISEHTQDEESLAGIGDPADDSNGFEPLIPPSSNEDVNEMPASPSEKRGYVPHMRGVNVDDESHFFGYFTVIGVICIAGYVGYHNKQKILAMLVEGRRSRSSRGSRRPSTANYRKLDCTLEEAVTSQCNSNVTHVIY